METMFLKDWLAINKYKASLRKHNNWKTQKMNRRQEE